MSLVSALRSATAPIHQQLDSAVPLDRIISSEGAYIAYLKWFHDSLAEAWALMDWNFLTAAGLPDASRRIARFEALGRDLDALGSGVRPLPAKRASQPPGTSLGCAYVLEGSVHGGQHILTAIEERRGPQPASTTRFLRGFGDDRAKLWREFVVWLDGFPTDDGTLRQATESAEATFSIFLRNLSTPRPS